MTHAQAVETRAAERYLLDEMPELERYAFEAHYFECTECAEDVRMGGLMRDGVREGLLGEAERGRQKAEGTRQKAEGTRQKAEGTRQKESTRQKAEGWGRVLPWAVAASLALAVGYQQLWLVPELRSQIPSSQGLSPVTLRSATRGGEPAVARPTTGVLTLAFDFAGVPAGTRLSYDLRAADGSSVASGAAVAPSPGTPLLLLVPASAVRDAGSYVLAVRADGVAGPASADYRFTVTEQ